MSASHALRAASVACALAAGIVGPTSGVATAADPRPANEPAIICEYTAARSHTPPLNTVPQDVKSEGTGTGSCFVSKDSGTGLPPGKYKSQGIARFQFDSDQCDGVSQGTGKVTERIHRLGDQTLTYNQVTKTAADGIVTLDGSGIVTAGTLKDYAVTTQSVAQAHGCESDGMKYSTAADVSVVTTYTRPVALASSASR